LTCLVQSLDQLFGLVFFGLNSGHDFILHYFKFCGEVLVVLLQFLFELLFELLVFFLLLVHNFLNSCLLLCDTLKDLGKPVDFGVEQLAIVSLHEAFGWTERLW